MMVRIGKRRRFDTTIHSQLPEEIMHDILSRIPIETLSQCRFVSKNWFNLINDPDFLKLHHSRINKHGSVDLIALCHNTNNAIMERFQFYNLVECHENNPIPTSLKALSINFDLPSLQQSHAIKIVGSVNGLMCLCILPRHNVFYLCNPVTSEILQLPKAPGLGPYLEKYNLEFLYPSSSGFGFHAATNTYKVVRTWFFRVKGFEEVLKTGIEIYNVGSGVWRWIDQDMSSIMCHLEVSQVFVNDALHWQIEDYKDWDNLVCKHDIGVIDIGDETFRTFEKPTVEYGFKTRTLSSLRNCLCLMDESNDYIAVWTMKQYGVARSWTKEHVIRKEMFGLLKSMFFDTLTTIHNRIIIIHGGEYQGYYDLEKQEYKQILVDGFQSPRIKLQIVGHVGSFISPRSITCTSDVHQVLPAKPRRNIGFRLQKNVKNPSRPFACITGQREFLW